MTQDLGLHRTYLYASGTRPRSMSRALDAGADAVILDLEDSVAPEDKDSAREAVATFIADRAVGAPCDVHVRINRTADGFAVDDVRAVVRPGVAALRLPKVESAAEVRALDALVTDLEREAGVPSGSIGFYPTVESARGALALMEVLQATNRSRRPAFGLTDFVADISASGDDDLATLHVRSHMALVARAAGCGMPIDSVHPHIDDTDGLVASARRGLALGFFGKSVVHPRQVQPVNEVFTPDRAAVNWARQVVAGVGDAQVHTSGHWLVDGEVLDPAVLQRARAIVRIHEQA